MTKILRSVGRGGMNHYADVSTIQKLLNKQRIPGVTGQLKLDGNAGSNTITRIELFQKNVMKMEKPDGRIDPGGKTMAKLTGATAQAKNQRPANVTAFINKTLTDAKSIKEKYKVPVSILIAQAALESGWGRSVKDNAYFGIKAHKTSGSTTSFTTTEFVNGKKVTTTDAFRAYANFGEAAEDYGKFLTTNARHKAAFAYANDPARFAEELQKAGYATDPKYADKLKTIISTYKLGEYDQ